MKDHQLKAKKLIKGLIIRDGENPFVLKAIFVCRAIEQNWTKQEIEEVLNEAGDECYKHFIQVLKSYSEKHIKKK